MAGKPQTEARRWYQQATFDLKAAAWNIQGGFHDTACFLAQQAGEKALKSLLYYQGARREALLSHSLVEMVQEAAKTLDTLSTLRGARARLGPALHSVPVSERAAGGVSSSILRQANGGPGAAGRWEDCRRRSRFFPGSE